MMIPQESMNLSQKTYSHKFTSKENKQKKPQTINFTLKTTGEEEKASTESK